MQGTRSWLPVSLLVVPIGVAVLATERGSSTASLPLPLGTAEVHRRPERLAVPVDVARGDGALRSTAMAPVAGRTSTASPRDAEPGAVRLDVRWSEEGGPARDLPVELRRGTLESRHATSGPDGSVRFEGLEPGRWQAMVLRQSVAFDAAPGATARVEVELPTGTLVSGRVVDADGGPIENAHLYAGDPIGRVGGPTDALGRFEAVRLGSERRLCAIAPGYAASPLVAVEGERADVTISLTAPGCSLSGAVVDELERPIAGVTVRLEATAPARFSARAGCYDHHATRIDVVSDDAGRFERDGLGEGTWRVRAASLGRALAETRVTLAPGCPELVTLRLLAEAVLRGVVLDADGEPMSARVDVAGLEGAIAYTRDDGTYAIHHLPGGVVRVVAEGDGGQRAEVDLTLAEGAETLWSPRLLGRAAKLRGSVVDPAGRGLAGLNVLAFAEAPTWSRQVTTDAVGFFELECPPRTLSLWVTPSAQEMDPSVTLHDLEPDGAPLSIFLTDTGTASARVFGALTRSDRSPAVGAIVRATSLGTARRRASTTVDERGEWRLGPLPADEYSIVAIDVGAIHPLARCRLQAGRSTELGAHRLAPLGDVVVAATGREDIAESDIEIRMADGTVILRRPFEGPAPWRCALAPGTYDARLLSPQGTVRGEAAGLAVRSGAETIVRLATPVDVAVQHR